MLAWTIYLTFAGALAQVFIPRDHAAAPRAVALITAAAGLVIAAIGAATHGSAFVSVANAPWIRLFGIDYRLGHDGISATLALLTGIASFVGVLFSWNIERRRREFFGLYLALIGSVYGVFLSFDLFLIFVFYELAIIPKYFLIAIWGSTRREYAAMKLALYSFAGSALVLIVMIAAFIVAGSKTMNLFELAKFQFPEGFQAWAFPVSFIGFAILAGLWPFHTWAPTGHVAAPTGASMLLAGVIMKLGAYCALRVSITLFPAGAQFWQQEIALLAVVGIIYGAGVAMTQRDLKFVIGYSSVSHMGFVILGLMTLNEVGLTGAVLQMFSHGIIAGLLFAVVGRMIYDRTHTRDLAALEGFQLAKSLPFAAATFAVASFASMGIPGFSGFIAELHVLLGAWQSFPTFALLAGLGIVAGVAYSLRALTRGFYSDNPPAAAAQSLHLSPLSTPERLGAAILIFATGAIGLYPRPLADLIVPAFSLPLFDGLRKGAGL